MTQIRSNSPEFTATELFIKKLEQDDYYIQTGKDLMGWLDSMLQWEYISLGWNGEAVHSIFSDRDFFTMEEMFQPLQEITGKQSGFQEVR